MTAVKLKKMRAKNKISQIRLAQLSGVSRYNISLAENDYRKLLPSESKKIENAISKLNKGVK